MGSGFLTHNLRMLDPRPDAPPPAWAAEFDAWAEDVLRRRDVDALLDYRARAPGVRQALPSHEHFVPVVVATGAAIDDSAAAARFPNHGVRVRLRDPPVGSVRLDSKWTSKLVLPDPPRTHPAQADLRGDPGDALSPGSFVRPSAN